MNIFFLDRDPRLAAESHDDKRVGKMILESAQLLSGAIFKVYGEPARAAWELYKPTHLNHPCAIWTRASLAHFLWLGDLALALDTEFSLRFGGHGHKSAKVAARAIARAKLDGEVCECNDGGLQFPSNQWLTDPPQCMPDAFKQDDTVLAYRNYYASKPLVWDKVSRPNWLFCKAQLGQ